MLSKIDIEFLNNHVSIYTDADFTHWRRIKRKLEEDQNPTHNLPILRQF